MAGDWDRFDQEQNYPKETNVPSAKRVVQRECLIIAAVAMVEVILISLAPAVGYLALIILIFVLPFFLAVYAVRYLVYAVKSIRNRPYIYFTLFVVHILIILMVYLVGNHNTNMYNPWSLGESLPFL